MKFQDLLARADEEILENLLGKTVLRLLNILGGKYHSSRSLQEILLSIYSPEDLLLSKGSRDLLLDLLRLPQAQTLAMILGIAENQEPYQALKNLKFRQSSEEEYHLLNFFELSRPIRKQQEIPPPEIPTVPKYSLFPHQRRVAQKAKQYLQKEPYKVMLHLPTGAGKTRTAMNIIADHFRLHEPTVVIWLAYSEELCEQALSEFISAWNFLGNRHLNTYRFWGKQEIDIESLKDGMIVAGLTKFHNLVKKNWESIKPLARRISLVIIDEAHQAIAPTYRNTLDLLTIPQPTGLIGLSATPGRTWNNIKSDAALSDFFGRCKVTLSIPGVDNPIDYLVEEKYLAQVNFRTLFYQSGLELTSEDLAKIKEEVEIPQYILYKLEIDEQRNLGIILEIEKLAKQHQRIIVFAISVNHCQIISTVLKLRNLEARFVTGKTPSYQREKIINWFKEHNTEPRILCNYGVLTTGFDAPKTSAIVIARPTKSLVLYSQMVGRGIRGVKAGGNSHAEIVTVVDTEIPGFRNIAETFNNWEDVWSENT